MRRKNKNILKFIALMSFCFNLTKAGEAPVPVYEMEKTRDRAELNINVRKISTTEIEGSYDVEKAEIVFKLPEAIKSSEGIYISDDLEVLKNKRVKTREFRNLEYRYSNDEVRIKLKENFEYNRLFFYKYSKEGNALLKLYSWNNKMESLEEKRGYLDIEFTDEYLPYETVTIDKSRMKKNIIAKGNFINLPENVFKVELLDLNGDVYQTLKIVSGNGEYGLDSSTKGLELNNSKGYAKVGVGFENRNLTLKLKEWSSDKNSYDFIVRAYVGQGKFDYKLTLTTPAHKLKLLNNELNLDFGNSSNRDWTPETSGHIRIQAPINTIAVKTEFKNEGRLVMVNSEENDSITAILTTDEAVVESENEGLKTMGFNVKGKIIEDITNKKDGVYTGKTELIISIDS